MNLSKTIQKTLTRLRTKYKFIINYITLLKHISLPFFRFFSWFFIRNPLFFKSSPNKLRFIKVYIIHTVGTSIY